MGGHDLKPPPIPDWRIYRVEDVPELVKLRKDLAARGLSNPWLRNEVWRYVKDPAEANFISKFKYMFGGGFKYGVGAAIITIIAEKAYHAYTEGGNEHHDDHH